MDKKELKTFSLTQEAFDALLEKYQRCILEVPDISEHLHGSIFKDVVICDRRMNKLVVPQVCLEFLGHKAPNDWIQCICLLKSGQKEPFKKTINGGQAWRDMKRILLKYYTEEEFEQCLDEHVAPYDKDLCQWRVNVTEDPGTVLRLDKCVKYDMNGAYATALCEIFPRAKGEITKLYRERRKNPTNKELINYFVGMLKTSNKTNRKPHDGTYNWIVQKNRKDIEATAMSLGGVVVYAHTDGFIVCDPERTLPASYRLGGYKIEYTGTVYVYQGENYLIHQCGSEISGNLPRSLRHLVDLSKGQVVKYHRVKKGPIYVPEDVEVKTVEVI